VKISAADHCDAVFSQLMPQSAISNNPAPIEGEGILVSADSLKHPRLMELLCAPDGNGKTPLQLAGNELTGAARRVPIVGDIPDFVTF
jgi:hypothetical protein